MTCDLAADGRNRAQFGQEPGSIQQDRVVPADEKFIEIPEDAYKQNNVYRPWQPSGVNVGDRSKGNSSTDCAAGKRVTS